MGFVQLLQLANQLIFGSEHNQTDSSGDEQSKLNVQLVMKIHMQLKFLMKKQN